MKLCSRDETRDICDCDCKSRLLGLAGHENNKNGLGGNNMNSDKARVYRLNGSISIIALAAALVATPAAAQTA